MVEGKMNGAETAGKEGLNKPVVKEVTGAKLKDTSDLYEAYQPRQVTLLVNRIDPWTVMKMSFLLSIIFGLVMLLVVFILWNVLNAMHVFSSIADLAQELGSNSGIQKLVEYMRLPRVLGITMIFAILNTVLITALSAIAAIIYNLCASLVGGVKLTLMDD